jgi:hypothetical protein
MVYQLAQLFIHPTLRVDSRQDGKPSPIDLPRGKLL